MATKDAPKTKGQIIRNHIIVWAFVGISPYLMSAVTALFGDTADGFGTWFTQTASILVGSVLIAAALCALELGLLFNLQRTLSLGRKVRATIPAITIFLLALALPSPAITGLFPPSSASVLPLLIVVAVAAILGTGVFISHWLHSASSHSAGMGPAGQD